MVQDFRCLSLSKLVCILLWLRNACRGSLRGLLANWQRWCLWPLRRTTARRTTKPYCHTVQSADKWWMPTWKSTLLQKKAPKAPSRSCCISPLQTPITAGHESLPIWQFKAIRPFLKIFLIAHYYAGSSLRLVSFLSKDPLECLWLQNKSSSQAHNKTRNWTVRSGKGNS